jgi:hypothetical protein
LPSGMRMRQRCNDLQQGQTSQKKWTHQ